MPSTTMSSAYNPVPNAFSAASIRCKRDPTVPSASFLGTGAFSLNKRAANKIASSIFTYPVQRQIFPNKAF